MATKTEVEATVETGVHTIEVRVDGKPVVSGTATWKPSASGRNNLNIFGKVAVDSRYCQLGLNITEIQK